jgi:hypothetical protein
MRYSRAHYVQLAVLLFPTSGGLGTLKYLTYFTGCMQFFISALSRYLYPMQQSCMGILNVFDPSVRPSLCHHMLSPG